MPSAYLPATSIDEGIETNIYQMALWHTKFAEMLNIVVIVKRNLQTHKTAHVVLFSSDLTLGYAPLIDYYRDCSESTGLPPEAVYRKVRVRTFEPGGQHDVRSR